MFSRNFFDLNLPQKSPELSDIVLGPACLQLTYPPDVVAITVSTTLPHANHRRQGSRIPFSDSRMKPSRNAAMTPCPRCQFRSNVQIAGAVWLCHAEVSLKRPENVRLEACERLRPHQPNPSLVEHHMPIHQGILSRKHLAARSTMVWIQAGP